MRQHCPICKPVPTLLAIRAVVSSYRGGGGQSFSFSSISPTVSVSDGLQEKRFRKGDVNPSDGSIFWCYERDRRVDGSVLVRERWMTPQRYAAARERKKENDARYMAGETFKQGADKRRENRKRWNQSDLGKASRAKSRSKPEYKERKRKQSKEYYARPEVQERRKQYRLSPERRDAERARYERLKQDPESVAKNKQAAREWRVKNRERFKELQRRWRDRNPGRVNEYIKRRYAEEPKFALAFKLRARVRQAIKASGASKSGRTEELVGCSIEFLRQHIERQFKGKMSWDNPDSFHIDHIVPVSSFDLTDIQQQRVAFNWQNMRPLSPKKNLSKGAKLTEPQLPLPLTVYSTTISTP